MPGHVPDAQRRRPPSAAEAEAAAAVAGADADSGDGEAASEAAEDSESGAGGATSANGDGDGDGDGGDGGGGGGDPSATLLSGFFGVMFAIVTDGQRELRVGNRDAFAALVALACDASRRPRVRSRAVACLREVILHCPTNVVCLVGGGGGGGGGGADAAAAAADAPPPLIDSLLDALRQCDEPPPPAADLTDSTGWGSNALPDGSLFHDLSHLLCLSSFLLSADDAYVARRLLASAELPRVLPDAQRAAAAAAADGDGTGGGVALRWREAQALCRLTADLVARGGLRRAHWQRFALNLATECLAALRALDDVLAAQLNAAALAPTAAAAAESEAASSAAWFSNVVLQMLGCLVCASPPLLVHIERQHGVRTLAHLVSRAAAAAHVGVGGAAGVWEGALWLLQEVVGLGARSGRLQSVDEFAALLRSCARPVASNSPEEAAGENSPLPEALRAALADWPSYAGAPATPGVMPPAAVLAVATAAAHLVRRAPRRHLHGLRKHLVEGGGLLALIALLYAPLPPEAEPPEAAAAAEGDAAAAASANPVVHAAMLALGEVCCDSEATKTAVLSLVTADELLALHRRAPPRCARCSATFASSSRARIRSAACLGACRPRRRSSRRRRFGRSPRIPSPSPVAFVSAGRCSRSRWSRRARTRACPSPLRRPPPPSRPPSRPPPPPPPPPRPLSPSSHRRVARRSPPVVAPPTAHSWEARSALRGFGRRRHPRASRRSSAPSLRSRRRLVGTRRRSPRRSRLRSPISSRSSPPAAPPPPAPATATAS